MTPASGRKFIHSTNRFLQFMLACILVLVLESYILAPAVGQHLGF